MVNRSDIHLFAVEELTIVPGAWSTLERREESIYLEVDAAGAGARRSLHHLVGRLQQPCCLCWWHRHV